MSRADDPATPAAAKARDMKSWLKVKGPTRFGNCSGTHG